MSRYNTIIKDFATFQSKVIAPIAVVVGDVEWLKHNDPTEGATAKYFNNRMIDFVLRNKFGSRMPYWKEEEFLGYFNNRYMTFAPMLYARVSNIVEDKLQELRTNKNVGVRTTIENHSKRGDSTAPYNNDMSDVPINVDEVQVSDHTQGAYSENMLENAYNLSKAKINGEIEKFVGSFDDLFTQIDMEKKMADTIPDTLYDLILNMAKSLDELKTRPVAKYQGEFTDKEWNDRPNKQPGDFGFLIGATPADNRVVMHTSLEDITIPFNLSLDSIKKDIITVKNTITQLENTVNGFSGRIGRNEMQVSFNKGDITGLKTRVTALEQAGGNPGGGGSPASSVVDTNTIPSISNINDVNTEPPEKFTAGFPSDEPWLLVKNMLIGLTTKGYDIWPNVDGKYKPLSIYLIEIGATTPPNGAVPGFLAIKRFSE